MDTYDAIVVGARCAGSATAMLLARAGLDVLLVDRADPTRDTLSTHALMRGGVLQLQRWGLLDAIRAAGTPPIHRTTFRYGASYDPDVEIVEMREPLYAPRRTVLDTVLLDAARRAGATVRIGVDVTDLLRSGNRVTGIDARVRGGGPLRASAPLTVGADGVRSAVARLAGARTVRRGRAAGAIVYGYFAVPATGSGYEWSYVPGASAGVIPTNDGLACVWAGVPAASFHRDTEALFGGVLDRVGVRVGPQRERLRGFPGVPAVLRETRGPGWALVGDAGFFKDPLTAHGITDALRDAELLARSVVSGEDRSGARDRLSRMLFSVAEEIAGYRWDLPELRALLLAESAVMRAEVSLLRGLDAPAAVAA
ncbi:NAD(P)/FAD-dependent oxidoreductase [Pseudonocardia ailaonensis]|uniref:NAD(P)/FAD-dependent oxidoreductase n=1 Tax=Pseudonocardia ailaonensis TaxID=367279 RepID=A0ABN2N0V5_9PSEU